MKNFKGGTGMDIISFDIVISDLIVWDKVHGIKNGGIGV